MDDPVHERDETSAMVRVTQAPVTAMTSHSRTSCCRMRNVAAPKRSGGVKKIHAECVWCPQRGPDRP
jgi:hypothetical protein